MKLRWKNALLLSAKVGSGSALAILLATVLGLHNATAAGTVALLTLINTRRDTLKLVVNRILTFFITVSLCLVIYPLIDLSFVAFGLITFFLVMVCELGGWQNTLSVNALINMHFFLQPDHTWHFIANELVLVLIGIAIAFVFNQFYNYADMEKDLKRKEEHCDGRIQQILLEAASYVQEIPQASEVWLRCSQLEDDLNLWIKDAREYHDNRLHPDSDYYLAYFTMRQKQLIILHSLHRSLKAVRTVPRQAREVQEILELTAQRIYVKDNPVVQLARLESILEGMKTQPLPAGRSEFETRAVLFHILLDLEAFVQEKVKFLSSLTASQKAAYVNNQPTSGLSGNEI